VAPQVVQHYVSKCRVTFLHAGIEKCLPYFAAENSPFKARSVPFQNPLVAPIADGSTEIESSRAEKMPPPAGCQHACAQAGRAEIAAALRRNSSAAVVQAIRRYAACSGAAATAAGAQRQARQKRDSSGMPAPSASCRPRPNATPRSPENAYHAAFPSRPAGSRRTESPARD